MNHNSSVNQTIKGKLVEREVYANVGTMVEYILSKSYEERDTPFSWDDVTNLHIDHSEKIADLKEKYDELQEQIDEVDETEETETQESQDMLDAEEISEFTHERNVQQIEERFTLLRNELEKQMQEIQDQIDELEGEDGDQQEVYEWWMVSSWLCCKLKERGEVVLEDESIWGRCGTGQAILLDWVISDIAEEMEILEGQKYEWKVNN